jgi:hypothetical protein
VTKSLLGGATLQGIAQPRNSGIAYARDSYESLGIGYSESSTDKESNKLLPVHFQNLLTKNYFYYYLIIYKHRKV